jgi:hypothetical protein
MGVADIANRLNKGSDKIGIRLSDNFIGKLEKRDMDASGIAKLMIEFYLFRADKKPECYYCQ